MIFVEAAKVQVGKDVAKQDEPLERDILQQIAGVPSTAQLGTEMQVGQNERVETCKTHYPGCS